MARFIFPACLLIVMGFTSCASQSAGITTIKDDTVKLKAQIAVLLQDTASAGHVDSLKAHIRRLEDLIREQTSLMWSMKADLNSKITAVNNRLQTLDAKITGGDRQFSVLTGKMDRVSALLATVTTPDTVQSRPTDPSELYNTAQADFQRGNYELAISQFMQYLQYFPDAQLAQNAQYWIGECYYTGERYTQALSAFEEVLTKYPGGTQTPAAVLRIGFTHLALNDKNNGLIYLDRVIKEFPNSEEAMLARLRQETLPGR